MKKQQLLDKLERAWTALRQSYASIDEAQMTQPGVTGNWAVKDILAHVTTWEEEALKYLPLILRGERPPRYKDMYDGIDAFNAQMATQKQALPLSEVLRQFDDTHRRLVAAVQNVPEEHIARETPFRRRLRLDTSRHYPVHARPIRQCVDLSP